MIHISEEENKPYAQADLDGIRDTDTFGFLPGVMGNNWMNHRPLLYLALSLTEGKVIEMGAGLGSTYVLHKYCESHKREFISYDNHPGWVDIFPPGMVKLVNSWDSDIYKPCSVAFIDHAPGEHRKIAIEKFIRLADIIVVHDSELNGAGDYQLEPVLSKFEYRLNYNLTGGGAGATAVSNKYKLTAYRGLKLGDHLLDNN